jgi:hypothetical protein
MMEHDSRSGEEDHCSEGELEPDLSDPLGPNGQSAASPQDPNQPIHKPNTQLGQYLICPRCGDASWRKDTGKCENFSCDRRAQVRALLLVLVPIILFFGFYFHVAIESEVAWWRMPPNPSVSDYKKYLNEFPDTRHTVRVNEELQIAFWREIVANPTKQSLDNYLQIRPWPLHYCDAAVMLAQIDPSRSRFKDASDICVGNDSKEQWIKRESAQYNALDDHGFLEADSKHTIAGYRDYLTVFRDGNHRLDAENAIAQLQERAALKRLIAVVRTDRVSSILPRKGVQVVLIDKEPHATLVSQAVRSQFDFNVKILSMDRPLVENLLTLMKWKEKNRGIDYVVNMSWGYKEPDEFDEQLFKLVSTLGFVFVGAAGNSGNERLMYPAGYESVIAVGSADNSGQVAEYSNRGPGLNVLIIDKSRDGLKSVVQQFKEVLSTECKDTQLYSDGTDSLLENVLWTYIQDKAEKEGVASGTSVASGVFSGYIAKQMDANRDISVQQFVNTIKAFKARLEPLEFGAEAHPEFDPPDPTKICMDIRTMMILFGHRGF